MKIASVIPEEPVLSSSNLPRAHARTHARAPHAPARLEPPGNALVMNKALISELMWNYPKAAYVGRRFSILRASHENVKLFKVYKIIELNYGRRRWNARG